MIAELLRGMYARVKRTGVLEGPLGRRAFIDAYFAYKRWIEDPFHALRRAHPELFRGGHILDVGANVGYTAVLFAAAAAPGYRVYAFEPEARNLQMLAETLRRRDRDGRVVAVPSAVGDFVGSIEMWHNNDHHGDHRVLTPELRATGRATGMTVPITTIDAFVAEHRLGPIGLIKVDVQGYELPVVRGMARTLAENPAAVVAFELSPEMMIEAGFAPEALLDAFAPRRLHAMDRKGRLEAVTAEEAMARAGGRGYLDLVAMV